MPRSAHAAPTFSVSAREFTINGEPCGVQTIEYACAERFGRMRKITP